MHRTFRGVRFQSIYWKVVLLLFLLAMCSWGRGGKSVKLPDFVRELSVWVKNVLGLGRDVRTHLLRQRQPFLMALCTTFAVSLGFFQLCEGGSSCIVCRTAGRHFDQCALFFLNGLSDA